jgi:hypothetical protein
MASVAVEVGLSTKVAVAVVDGDSGVGEIDGSLGIADGGRVGGAEAGCVDLDEHDSRLISKTEAMSFPTKPGGWWISMLLKNFTRCSFLPPGLPGYCTHQAETQIYECLNSWESRFFEPVFRIFNEIVTQLEAVTRFLEIQGSDTNF